MQFFSFRHWIDLSKFVEISPWPTKPYEKFFATLRRPHFLKQNSYSDDISRGETIFHYSEDKLRRVLSINVQIPLARPFALNISCIECVGNALNLLTKHEDLLCTACSRRQWNLGLGPTTGDAATTIYAVHPTADNSRVRQTTCIWGHFRSCGILAGISLPVGNNARRLYGSPRDGRARRKFDGEMQRQSAGRLHGICSRASLHFTRDPAKAECF